ncbi:MAG: XdhC family protein [Lachnospiraceae bacterium]
MSIRDSYEQLITDLKTGPVWSATVLDGARTGQKQFWDQTRVPDSISRTGKAGKVYINGETLFVERLSHSPQLVICGGGHISQELAVLSDYLEYTYTVLDDREEFCNQKRFPHASACICKPYREALTELDFQSANIYYIIVTRGHQADIECLELILNRPYGYIGMIGSKAKVARTMELLLSKEYTSEQLSQVHAPIGLDIGGQTPKEIAVSIVGQLIQTFNQCQPSGYIEMDMVRHLRQRTDGVMATIIDKQGSAPRGTGSRMLVGRDGIICGTIGGGKVEYEAVKKAADMLAQPDAKSETITYQVNNQSAASLGMWCGGQVEVLFERL